MCPSQKEVFRKRVCQFYIVLICIICPVVHLMGQNFGKSLSSELVLKLNPQVDNPRNSEGDFITLSDGRILFVYTHYTGESTDDHAPAFLAGRYSLDGGKTWSDKDEVILKGEGGMNIMSVSFLRMQNGTIAMFYLRKYAETDCIPMVRFSTDEARTWSESAPCITDRQGYFVLNNNRVIQLGNGRLLMAVARHRTPATVWENKGALFSYYSDDNGRSWKSGAQIPDSTAIVTQEPGVIELKDGRIMMFIRASQGFQMLSYSPDKGETWRHIETSNLPSPVSPASIARIPLSGDLLMVWNNNKIKENGWHGGKRTPLTIAISKDEGKTWVHVNDIETDPDGWYCYTAIHFTKKEVLLGYCAGSQSKKTHLSVLNITRLSQEMLYQK